ncbi:hypothetical protein ACSVDE_10260 [Pseudalkalibacillus sp. Hm43]|uniref:hypothetical protein n=1 Tax=Pseudalkalibacillus sp. Hm43 TaxID=3450742 RepID=UPI003F43B19C
MNDYLSEMLIREIVKSLPEQKRKVYEYIVDKEEYLAQQSVTSAEFIDKLQMHSPYRQAAKHFRQPIREIDRLMKDIEKTIDAELHIKLNELQWLDCTDLVSKNSERKAAFLLSWNPLKINKSNIG